MEKYGVDTEQPGEKQAEHKKQLTRCPKCNATLNDVSKTGVSLCPNCGSQPFEEGR